MPEISLYYHPLNGNVIEITELATYDPANKSETPLPSGSTVLITVRTKADKATVAGMGNLVCTFRSAGEFYYVFSGSELSQEGAPLHEVIIHGSDDQGTPLHWILPLRVRERRSGELVA